MAPVDTLHLRVTSTRTRDGQLAVAAAALRAGKLVAFPTETVYGLGANIYDEDAVRAIFTAKGRPPDNPMIVHVADVDQAVNLAQRVPRHFPILADTFWPGPLTLVVPRNASVFDAVTAGLDTVAVRMPGHKIARALIAEAGVPLAAPSANRSGRPSPTCAEDVLAELGGRIFAVLDGGPCAVGIESTVLDLSRRAPSILRPGVVTREQLESVLGTRVGVARSNTLHPASPGMKYAHYAPATPLLLVLPSARAAGTRKQLAATIRGLREQGRTVGLLAAAKYGDLGADEFFSLDTGTDVEYARLMYRGLRALDTRGFDAIVCPGLPEEGLALAVMNRLRKAAHTVIKAHPGT
ncbi:MAG: threonylcarbamoyl-AMP synthase [Ignavibacteria bacterium]|nr:threonylcarbamoyl-AMP synthase [Ignavibacteria bacterium]